MYSIDGSTEALLRVEDDDPETIANSSVLEEAGEYSDSDDDSDMQIKSTTASNDDRSTKKPCAENHQFMASASILV